MKDKGRADDLTLYLVDDDEHTLRELERILTRHMDLTVLPFSTPSAALTAMEKTPPDLALIDLKLPEMDGLELLERMRREGAPGLMAILMTGYGEAGSAKRARESGALDFVEKPLDLPYLLVVLRQMAREGRLRKNLQSSARLFARVLDMMPDGILMADASGEPLFSNSLGRRLWDEGPWEHGERRTVEEKVYLLDRTEAGDRVLWHWINLTTVLDRERFLAYKQMARHLAHEVKNPLTPMRLWLQELDAAGGEGEEYRKAVETARAVLLDQVDRMAAVADRFRDLAREEPLRPEPLRLYPVLAKAARVLAPLAERNGTNLRLPGDGGWTAMAEEGGLYQCFFNLLRNAIEAMDGGAVTVRVAGEGGEVIVEVADSGGGLTPEVAEAPFTPYLTTKKEGTGLGLLLSRDLAERMGGRLELLNRPGEGLTVRLILKESGALPPQPASPADWRSGRDRS